MLRMFMLLMVVMLSGCASNMLVPKPVSGSDLSGTEGILFGSFARSPEARKYNVQTFRFKEVATGKTRYIEAQPIFNFLNGRTPDDFQEEDSHGGLFVYALPAGEYIFYNFSLYQEGAYGRRWEAREPYAIPFSVHPDKVNYVGEIKLVPVEGRNILGLPVQDGGFWIISDKMERDSEILIQKAVDVPLDRIVSVIPDEKDIFTPLVILPSEQMQLEDSED